MNEPAMRIEDPKSEKEIDPFLPTRFPTATRGALARNSEKSRKETR
jgi:hypothetical protein